jgi:hypothetical protein
MRHASPRQGILTFDRPGHHGALIFGKMQAHGGMAVRRHGSLQTYRGGPPS